MATEQHSSSMSSNRTRTSQTRPLYLLQLLSSCAVRSSEFSLSLFLAGIYPHTLFYISIHGLGRAVAAVLLGPLVGAYVDSQDRLRAMSLSIVCQRLSIALSCILILFLSHLPEPQFALSVSSIISVICFAAVVLLGGVEKLAAMANLIALERDWLVIIAEAETLRRQDLNASLRRVDLLGKLLAPTIIGLIDESSPRWTMIVVSVSNVASVALEIKIASKLYNAVPELMHRQAHGDPVEMQLPPPETRPRQVGGYLLSTKSLLISWAEYRSSPIFLASFSGCLLWWTVLYVGGPMITYLRSIGFTPLQITSFRATSVVAELGGTWLAPILMDRFGPPRAGLYFLLWQVACLAVFGGPFLTNDITTTFPAVSLALGITFKRLGLWGLDLAVQFMVQEVSPIVHSCFKEISRRQS